jgi:PAS domain-containing protein
MDPQRPPDASPAPSAFLPAERTTPTDLAAEIAHLARAPLVTALLEASGSAAFVLDGRRQVVAVNAEYPKLLGLEDPCSVLGLRPGEAAGRERLRYRVRLRLLRTGARGPAVR